MRIKIPCFYHMKVTPIFHDMHQHEGIHHLEIRILHIFKTTSKNVVSKHVTYALLALTLSHIDVFLLSFFTNMLLLLLLLLLLLFPVLHYILLTIKRSLLFLRWEGH